MKNDILGSLGLLSDPALVAGLKSSLACERSETASVVAHLAELDTRDMHLREGYPSLFVYCRDALGMSEGEAYNRIEVTRAARRFPVVLEMLADGRVHLTAVRVLAPHLTPDNHRKCSARPAARRSWRSRRSWPASLHDLTPPPPSDAFRRLVPSLCPALPRPQWRIRKSQLRSPRLRWSRLCWSRLR